MQTLTNAEEEVIRRMKLVRYSQLSPRDHFPGDVVGRYIVEPYEVPKWLYYLDRNKEVALYKHEDGILAEGTTVPKTEEQFFRSVARHRRFETSSIYLTLFERYEEVLEWAKVHANNAKRECQIWKVDGERLRDYQYTILKPRFLSKVDGPQSEYLILHSIPNLALEGGRRVQPSTDIATSHIEA